MTNTQPGVGGQRSAALDSRGADDGWPVDRQPIPDDQLELWNFYYLIACRAPCDPTMVWTTDVETAALEAYIRDRNSTSKVLITPAHVLLQATAHALRKHPQLNRRVIRRRIYNYRQINLLLPIQKRLPDEVDLMLLEHADELPLDTIASTVWEAARNAARGARIHGNKFEAQFPRYYIRRLFWIHQWVINGMNLRGQPITRRQRTSSMLVNYLGFKDTAPLRDFKPSRFASESVCNSVSMGASEPRPVVVDNTVQIRPVAPLIIRSDHRLIDAHVLGQFAGTLRSALQNPWALDESSRAECREPAVCR